MFFCLKNLFLSFQPTRAQWQKVFYISAGICVVGWIVYMLLGSGKQQPWNTPFEDLLVPIDIPREPRKPVLTDLLPLNNPEYQFTDASHPGVE